MDGGRSRPLFDGLMGRPQGHQSGRFPIDVNVAGDFANFAESSIAPFGVVAVRRAAELPPMGCGRGAGDRLHVLEYAPLGPSKLLISNNLEKK